MKNKKNSYLTAIKIFIITLLISTGVSVITELFLGDMGIAAAVMIVVVLIFTGIFFDIVGVAFASCDQTPFISMSSRKIKKGMHALKLLKKADIVANICNDVIGDICGIVSGAAGAAIVIKIVQDGSQTKEFIWNIVLPGIIAALTVAGKALGKNIALKNNIKIVEMTGALISVFHKRREKHGKTKG